MATVINKKSTVELNSQNKGKKGRSRTIVINIYLIMILLSFSIVMTAFMFLSEFNDISSQGVIINELENNRSNLIIENEVWNMRIAKLKSMDVIEQQDVVKRMVTIDPTEIDFINLDQVDDSD